MKGTSLRNWTRKCAVKKFRRHLKVIILSILLLLLLLYGLRSSFSCGWSWPTGDEDAEFYDFEVLENSHNKHPEYMSTLLPNNQKIEEDGSRIINTTNGIVVVKDFQFTPHRRLPEGENVFKRAGASSIARQAGRRSGISDVDLGRKRPVPEIPHQQDFIYMLEESEGEDQLGVELKKMSKFTKKGVFHSEHRDKSWIHHLGNSLTAINKRGNYQGNDDLKSPTQKGYPQGLNSWEFGKKNSVSDSKQEERKYIFGRHWQPTKPHQNTIASPTLKKQSNCPYLPCPNYLNQEDLARFEDCQRKSNLYYERSEPQATKCRFRKGYSITSYYLAALASSPSAGIDRLRSILQETTGICTGSDTCDTDLRLKGMAGENVVSTAVLVVKTNAFPSVHDNVQLPVPRTSSKHDAVPVYDSVIFVLRNPYQFMLEEWSRRHSHGGTGTDPTVWMKFVMEQTSLWKKSIEKCLFYNRRLPALLVLYEHLQSDLELQVQHILRFLGLPPIPDLSSGVSWTGNGEGEPLLAFSEQQIVYVNSIISNMANLLSLDHRFADYVDISSYIFLRS